MLQIIGLHWHNLVRSKAPTLKALREASKSKTIAASPKKKTTTREESRIQVKSSKEAEKTIFSNTIYTPIHTPSLETLIKKSIAHATNTSRVNSAKYHNFAPSVPLALHNFSDGGSGTVCFSSPKTRIIYYSIPKFHSNFGRQKGGEKKEEKERKKLRQEITIFPCSQFFFRVVVCCGCRDGSHLRRWIWMRRSGRHSVTGGPALSRRRNLLPHFIISGAGERQKAGDEDEEEGSATLTRNMSFYIRRESIFLRIFTFSLALRKQ